MKKIYVIGSINDDVVAEAERHPSPGETVRGLSLNHYPGGKGANQAVAAARAGATTFMIGCTGTDASGQYLTGFLKKSGVDPTFVAAVESAPTGTAIITVASGENTIVVVPGANGLLTKDVLSRVTFAKGDLVIAQFETPVETTSEAFARARKASAKTLLNPAPAGTVPPELLTITDFLVVNEHEFEIVFGEPVRVMLDATTRPAALSGVFDGVLVVTLGADGAVVWAGNQRIREPGRTVTSIDSTGAGDCFVGYFAAGLVDGLSIAAAVAFANHAASVSVTRRGAASSIPNRYELAA